MEFERVATLIPHEVVRSHWAALIKCQEWQHFNSAEALIESAPAYIPEFLLCYGQELDPLTESCNKLLTLWPDALLVILHDGLQIDDVRSVIQAGAVGVCNAFMSERLATLMLDVIAAGQIWCGRSHLKAMTDSGTLSESSISPALEEQLTIRELELAKYVLKGFSNREIANHQNISERTVKAHLTNMFRKLGVKDRLQLALLLRSSDDAVRPALAIKTK